MVEVDSLSKEVDTGDYKLSTRDFKVLEQDFGPFLLFRSSFLYHFLPKKSEFFKTEVLTLEIDILTITMVKHNS